MKKVLLINPPSPFLIDSAAFPPLGLLYIAAELERWGCEVQVADYGLGNRNFVHWVPDYIGITGLTSHVPWIRNTIPFFRDMYPEARIILGGPHFSNVPEDGAKAGADVTCMGDGEASMISAVHFPTAPIRSGLVNIDEWPAPARYLIDLHAYHYSIGRERATPIMTARGCPFSCAYCSRGLGAEGIRYRKLELVAAELEELWFGGWRALMIYDDEMNVSTKRLRDVAGLLHPFKWRCFVRSNLFTAEQAEILAENNCVEVCCGVESGSDEILRNVNKRATVAEATSFVHLCKSVGLRTKVFLILGLPGETEATARATKDWLLAARPDNFDICPFTPYPGSRIFHHLDEYDIQIHESYWDAEYFHKGKPGEYQVVVSTSGLSQDRIGELREEIERDVRAELGLEALQ